MTAGRALARLRHGGARGRNPLKHMNIFIGNSVETGLNMKFV
jgi:hypothetical protein